MAKPWAILARVQTDEGNLELRQRGDRDFLVTINGRVLMSSQSNRSEQELGRLGCEGLVGSGARVLIGGLGLGFTLRSALSACPADARVVMCELTPAVVEWNQGPLAALTENAIGDRRVQVVVDDVAAVIRRAAGAGPSEQFDRILLDLYEGPNEGRRQEGEPFYGAQALQRTHRALRPGGVFAVWSEEHDAAFERRLQAAGFRFQRRHARSGARHVVYLASIRNEGRRSP